MEDFVVILKNPKSQKDFGRKGLKVGKRLGKRIGVVSGNETSIKKLPDLVCYANVNEVAGLEPQTSTEHLIRLFGLGLGNLPKKYNPISKGKNQHVYLIDSGISRHNEFEGANILNLHTATGDFTDSNGHGTAMASLIVGKTIGAAPEATLLNVKLFDGNKEGEVTVGQILDALHSVYVDHNKNLSTNVKTVCMPWKMKQNDIVDEMVKELNDNNLVCVAAAGNDGEDVSDISPAGVKDILTVGAVTDKFTITNYSNSWTEKEGLSNFGMALDMWAPGVDVAVADINSLSGYSRSSGSSIACALVAALATHYTARYPNTTSTQIKSTMIAEGNIPGKILLNADPSINRENIQFSLVKTDVAGEIQLSGYPSGRLLNIKEGDKEELDLRISPDVSNVVALDFSPLPPWITLNSDTGVLSIDATNLGSDRAPGVYIFAIKGTSVEGAVIEEYSIGVYKDDESEVWDAVNYYYNVDLNEYDVAEDFDIVTYTQLKG